MGCFFAGGKGRNDKKIKCIPPEDGQLKFNVDGGERKILPCRYWTNVEKCGRFGHVVFFWANRLAELNEAESLAICQALRIVKEYSNKKPIMGVRETQKTQGNGLQKGHPWQPFFLLWEIWEANALAKLVNSP